MHLWRFPNSVVPYGPELVGDLDLRLVALSVAVMALAAHAALSAIRRVSSSQSAATRLTWQSLGAISLGVGIWATHFTGMLAFSLPVPISYRLGTMVMAVIPATIGAGLALGMDDYLAKPVQRQALSQVVERWITTQRRKAV